MPILDSRDTGLKQMFDATSATLAAAPPKENNKLRFQDRAAHDWYRFVLSFPPHLVRDYASKFGLKGRQIVLDPFCGTGTTLVECKKMKLASIGIEPNPVACFASRTKVDWEVDPDALLAHAAEIAQITNEKLRREGIEEMEEMELLSGGRKPAPILRTLPSETWKFLLKDSISPLPLHKTLVLIETLGEQAHPRFSGHERRARLRTTTAPNNCGLNHYDN